MESDFSDPINLGRSEMVSINELIDIISDIADVVLKETWIPMSPRREGRNSDNTLILEKLGWNLKLTLKLDWQNM